jgi:endonuclease/exonuclease/phosphatase family metal-dependent hydrolase
VRLRVVTYNVHGLRGGVDAVAATLSRVRPDVACVQECGSLRAVRRLAAAAGMEVVSTHRPFNRVRNAVLFSLPLKALDRLVLDLPRDGRARRRGFVQVTLAAHGVRVTAVSTHLGLSAGERGRQAEDLMRRLESSPPPVILGGDLNESPQGGAARRLAASLTDTYGLAGEQPGYTYPAKRPTDRIDVVYVSRDVKVGGAWVAGGPDGASASDHLPVVVDLELPG